ncbi:hypothetical protein TVAG_503350, partial [Trichomonas vaginalis G3]
MQGWMRYHFFESKSNDIQNCDFSTYNCACSFQGNLIFGDDSGYLTYINNPTSDLNPIQFFDLPIKKLLTPTEISAILILAKNSTNSAILLANPELNETYSIVEFRDDKYIEPSFLTILNDASFLAFTHDYHTISIYKVPGIEAKNKSMVLFKQLEISQKITNLHFSKDNFGTIALYYTTESSIGCYTLQKNTFSHMQFEEFGVPTELSCIVSNGRLAICTDTKISFYTPNGIDLKFPSIELDSSPYKITWYREYLIGYFNSRSDSLRIYQLDTHCVFGTSKFGKESQFTLFEWGSVILVRIPGKLTILTEFSIEKKVNVLCSQSKQFEVALKLSKMHRMSEETVAEIHRQLGDSRLQKRDYDGAISEYIEAIGFLAPSYVITLFLEPQHAEYLIRYLEALHDRKLEDSRHTTLRFNCYTKLKRTDSINKIVEQCVSEANEGKDPNFDVDSAVDVLKQGGYIEQATKIALAYEKHITYCSIMDGISDYNAVYRQMKVMPPKILNYIIMNYGMKILHAFSEEQKKEFTEYIGDSCCQTFRVNEKEFMLKADQIHIIFCDFPVYELMFIRIISERNPRRLSENLWNRLIILTLNNDLSSIHDTIVKANYRYNDENILFALKLKLNEIRKQQKSDNGEVKSDKKEKDEENII